MLKKLQIKFIAITMVIITVMLCSILGTVYYFTKASLENESIGVMKSLVDKSKDMGRPGERREEIFLPHFTVQLDAHGQVVFAQSDYYDLSDTEFLDQVVQSVLNTGTQLGALKEYDLRFYRSNTPFGESLVFVDMSSEQTTLQNLVQTSVFIGIVSFIAFLCISILLAKWAIHPVEKAWKQQQQFVSDASHELKTPLTVIMANAELLESSENGESQVQYTGNILTMSRQMQRLLEQMLTLARADNRQTEIVFSPVDLSRLASDTTLPFEPVFFERSLTLESQIQPGICVDGAAAQLRQVLEIFLDNAQKYSTPCGKTVVTLEMRGRNRCLLSVANEGDPIPPEDLQNLFLRFYRQEEARSYSGSFGLGLSIAESIAKSHKGKIWAESKDGYNRFCVELPTL